MNVQQIRLILSGSDKCEPPKHIIPEKERGRIDVNCTINQGSNFKTTEQTMVYMTRCPAVRFTYAVEI